MRPIIEFCTNNMHHGTEKLMKSLEQNLFLDENVEINNKVYLLPELKKVDYFLKIENNCSTYKMDGIIQKLNNIDWISTVYEVNPETIKSKNNLIF